MSNTTSTLRLFSPLFPHLYRKNEYGDLENRPEDPSTQELIPYQEHIRAAIASDRFFIKPENEMDSQAHGFGFVMGGIQQCRIMSPTF